MVKVYRIETVPERGMGTTEAHEVFYTMGAIDAVNAIARHAGPVKLSIVTMSLDDYGRIPATSAAREFFRCEPHEPMAA